MMVVVMVRLQVNPRWNYWQTSPPGVSAPGCPGLSVCTSRHCPQNGTKMESRDASRSPVALHLFWSSKFAELAPL